MKTSSRLVVLLVAGVVLSGVAMPAVAQQPYKCYRDMGPATWGGVISSIRFSSRWNHRLEVGTLVYRFGPVSPTSCYPFIAPYTDHSPETLDFTRGLIEIENFIKGITLVNIHTHPTEGSKPGFSPEDKMLNISEAGILVEKAGKCVRFIDYNGLITGVKLGERTFGICEPAE
jgi:hypothetical protein